MENSPHPQQVRSLHYIPAPLRSLLQLSAVSRDERYKYPEPGAVRKCTIIMPFCCPNNLSHLLWSGCTPDPHKLSHSVLEGKKCLGELEIFSHCLSPESLSFTAWSPFLTQMGLVWTRSQSVPSPSVIFLLPVSFLHILGLKIS